ncbi:DNA polymerase III subunit gamma/tau [Belliella marina]|uniref:DNA polymerase III subunit gamma/tau n=1 Tax=Belliella marina TaxID=1644146 RepID=A0ABW4VUA8_9BACT
MFKEAANPFGAKKSPVQKTIAIPSSIQDARKMAAAKPVAQVSVQVEQEAKDEVNQLAEVFDENKLKNVLHEMVEEYKKDHKNLEVTVLKQPYKLEGEHITFFLNGEIQEDIFAKNKHVVMNIVRRRLNNYNVTISAQIQEDAVPEGKKLYTSTDKLNYLLEKHGALRELQRKFGLETDF